MRRQTFFEWWGCNVDALHYIIALIVLFVGVIVFGTYAVEKRAGSRETYQAWCKATNVEITYEEWRRLRAADLLPGQTKTKTVVIPVVTR